MYDIVELPMETAGPGVDSKYRLAVIAGQRALQVSKGSKPRVETSFRKPTTIALIEVQEGEVPFCTGEVAVEARRKDEEMYKQVLSDARSSYVDEEGNPLFAAGQPIHTPSRPPVASNEAATRETAAKQAEKPETS
ncbi:MAG: DNA-directed RNA polymerase subunit omega [Leptospirillia bacterium]